MAKMEDIAHCGRMAWRMMVIANENHDYDKMYFWNKRWCVYNDMIKEGKYD